MNWTELLTDAIEDNFRVADNLMAMVDDEDLDWKPVTGSNWMTTGQLLMHMTNSCGFCCRGFLTGDWSMPECDGAPEGEAPEHESMLPPAEALPATGSVRAAREALAVDRQLALDTVARAGEQKLANEKAAAPWDPDHAELFGRQFLGMVLHLQSHKNQLFYYLKLMGRDVNTMHLWGM
ncbi:DinB family protein [bacterium]|nr:DinB family protein [bacterium]